MSNVTPGTHLEEKEKTVCSRQTAPLTKKPKEKLNWSGCTIIRQRSRVVDPASFAASVTGCARTMGAPSNILRRQQAANKNNFKPEIKISKKEEFPKPKTTVSGEPEEEFSVFLITDGSKMEKKILRKQRAADKNNFKPEIKTTHQEEFPKPKTTVSGEPEEEFSVFLITDGSKMEKKKPLRQPSVDVNSCEQVEIPEKNKFLTVETTYGKSGEVSILPIPIESKMENKNSRRLSTSEAAILKPEIEIFKKKKFPIPKTTTAGEPEELSIFPIAKESKVKKKIMRKRPSVDGNIFQPEVQGRPKKRSFCTLETIHQEEGDEEVSIVPILDESKIKNKKPRRQPPLDRNIFQQQIKRRKQKNVFPLETIYEEDEGGKDSIVPSKMKNEIPHKLSTSKEVIFKPEVHISDEDGSLAFQIINKERNEISIFSIPHVSEIENENPRASSSLEANHFKPEKEAASCIYEIAIEILPQWDNLPQGASIFEPEVIIQEEEGFIIIPEEVDEEGKELSMEGCKGSSNKANEESLRDKAELSTSARTTPVAIKKKQKLLMQYKDENNDVKYTIVDVVIEDEIHED